MQAILAGLMDAIAAGNWLALLYWVFVLMGFVA